MKARNCPDHGDAYFRLTDCHICHGMGERESWIEDCYPRIVLCRACDGTGDDYICELCCEYLEQESEK